MKSNAFSVLSFACFATTALGGVLPVLQGIKEIICTKTVALTITHDQYGACTPSTVTVHVPTTATVTETITVTAGPPQPTCSHTEINIANPHFEEGTGTDVPGWSIAGYRLDVSSGRTEEGPYMGRASVRGVGMDTETQYVLNLVHFEEIPVCPGRTYTFQAFLRQENPENCEVQLRFTDTILGAASRPGTSWAAMSRTYTIPEGESSVYLVVYGICPRGGPGNNLFVDEVSLTLMD